MKSYFRKMTASDVEKVYAIENEAFATPWTRQSLKNEIEKNKLAHYMVLVGGETEDLIGYFGLWIILDEADITNIAVAKAYRGRGYGSKLMEQLITYVRNKGIRQLTLEVRRFNEPAKKLYEKYGFEVKGMRKGYYLDNGEDALIMWLYLEEES